MRSTPLLLPLPAAALAFLLSACGGGDAAAPPPGEPPPEPSYTWSEPQSVPLARPLSSLAMLRDVRADAGGGITAWWSEGLSINRFVRRDRDGRWVELPQAILPLDMVPDGLSFGSEGPAALLARGNHPVRAAVLRFRDGAWSDPLPAETEFAFGSGSTVGTNAVAQDDAGRGYYVTLVQDSNATEVRSRPLVFSFAPDDGAPQAELLAAGENAFQPALIARPEGRLLLLTPGATAYEYREFVAGRGWSAPAPVPPAMELVPTPGQSATPVIDAAGRACFLQPDAANGRTALHAVCFAGGSDWSRELLFEVEGEAFAAQLQFGPGGAALVSWYTAVEDVSCGSVCSYRAGQLQVRHRREVGAAWGEVQSLGARSRVDYRRPVVFQGPVAALAWNASAGLQVATCAATCGDPQRLGTAASDNYDFATDGAGETLLVWHREGQPVHSRLIEGR